jgi:hypothetical protein
MKLDFKEINGKAVDVSQMEYLYSYLDEDGNKIAVFEFEGEKLKKLITESAKQ